MARSLAVLVVLCSTVPALSGIAHRRSPEQPQRQRVNFDSVINWLPSSTETIFVAQGPLSLSGEPSDVRQKCFLPLYYGFSKEELSKLTQFSIQLAVYAARNFETPEELGIGDYEGCSVIVLDRPLDDLGQITSAGTARELGGHSVLELRGQDQTETVLYVAQLRRDVLVGANSRKFLFELLVRYDGDIRTERALAQDLAEWMYVDTAAPFWAIRHYRADLLKKRGLTGFKIEGLVDDQATGIVLHTDLKGENAFVRYVTGSKKPVKVLSNMWKVFTSEALLLQAGVTPLEDSRGAQIEIALKDSMTRQALCYFLLMAFGPYLYV